MAEFFLELFSEEIPARMQKPVTEAIGFALEKVLEPLGSPRLKHFYGPRRQAFAGDVAAATEASAIEVRGPKESAPPAALEGFCRKLGVAEDQLTIDGGYWWLRRSGQPVAAVDVIQTGVQSVLTSNFWPKSMRWGSGGDFLWVRPLRRIVCLLDGAVVPLRLGPVTAGDETEGHRVLAPGPFAVSSAAVWEEKLREHHVIADQNERRAAIADGIAARAAAIGLTVAPDAALLDEVTGLVECPVPLLGRIDEQFMELPPEVRELSMKINQKYFSLRDAAHNPAPYFAFVANLHTEDGGAAIIAGNERVLRARLADARHFWRLDLKTPLAQLLPRLDRIVFHAKLGTQRQRAERISGLSHRISERLGADVSLANLARLAGLYCKADLLTGMVGEFPELQGIMGGYYVIHHNPGEQGAIVGQAIRTHYQPKGPGDEVPSGLVPVSVALADKLDMLTEFFRIGEKPTGSGDPYALRRAALGVIRIILENELRLPLKPLLDPGEEVFGFIIERLRVKLRGEGRRFDILDAVLGAGEDDDLVRLMKRVAALEAMLGTEDGKNLLAAYKRAANILKIEDAKDGPHRAVALHGPFHLAEETDLVAALAQARSESERFFGAENYAAVMTALARLRPVIDAFFDKVTVNADDPALRRNRLGMLAQFRGTVDRIADFSRIEG